MKALFKEPEVTAKFEFYQRVKEVLIPGLGGFLTIFLLGSLGGITKLSLLIAPFGASCVLAFALPESPVAQPRNILLGHLISSLIGIMAVKFLPITPLSIALAVGLAISMMLMTKTTHPPAGADPIFTMTIGANWPFLLWPVATGTILIILMALIYNRTRGINYPKSWW